MPGGKAVVPQRNAMLANRIQAGKGDQHQGVMNLEVLRKRSHDGKDIAEYMGVSGGGQLKN